MNIKASFAAVLLGAGMIAAPVAVLAQGPGAYGRPGQPRGWDAPPREYTRAIQQKGFRDGMYGAQKDFENHRRPTVMNRDEYRNYRGPDVRGYRQAFQRGYNAWWQHQGPGPRR